MIMKCLYGTKRGVSVEKIYIIMRPSCKIVRNSKHPAISSNNYYFELLIYWWLNSINLLYLERSRFSLNYRFAVLKIFAPNCNVTTKFLRKRNSIMKKLKENRINNIYFLLNIES